MIIIVGINYLLVVRRGVEKHFLPYLWDIFHPKFRTLARSLPHLKLVKLTTHSIKNRKSESIPLQSNVIIIM